MAFRWAENTQAFLKAPNHGWFPTKALCEVLLAYHKDLEKEFSGVELWVLTLDKESDAAQVCAP